jgi:hypothetical protein
VKVYGKVYGKVCGKAVGKARMKVLGIIAGPLMNTHTNTAITQEYIKRSLLIFYNL